VALYCRWAIVAVGHGGQFLCVNNLSATCRGCSRLVGKANLIMTVMSAFDVTWCDTTGPRLVATDILPKTTSPLETDLTQRHQVARALPCCRFPPLPAWRYSRLSPGTTRCDHRVPGFIQVHNAPHLSNPVYTQHQRQLISYSIALCKCTPRYPYFCPYHQQHKLKL
jgi:hypothetical protein